MKKFIKIIFGCLIIVNLSFGSICSSYEVLIPKAANSDIKKDGGGIVGVDQDKFKNNIKITNKYLWIFFGAIAMGIIIFAGINLISAEGNEEQLKKANKTLIYGLVGIILSLGAYVIINVVINLL